jgi:adenosylcobinamide-phosphate synthase
MRDPAVGVGLLLGFLADLVVGDPRRWHPVAGFGRAAAAVEARAYGDGRAAGTRFLLLAAGPPVAAAVAAQRAVGERSALAALTGAVTWAAVGGRQLGAVALRIAGHLEAGEVEAARGWLPWLVGRDPSGLDADEVARAVVESVAENTADAVVGPLLWGAVAGPAGVVAFRAVNTLDAMVGHRSARYARFGTAAARADDLLGLVPARLTAALTVALAPVVGGSPAGALRAWRRDARRHPSPNAGPVEAAAAGALGVALVGEVRYGDRVERRGPLGDGPPPAVADIRRAVRLARAVGAAAAALCAASAAAGAGSVVRGTGRRYRVRGRRGVTSPRRRR